MRKIVVNESEIEDEDITLFKGEIQSDVTTFDVRRILSVEDMLQESGGFGRLHLITFILCIISGTISTTLIYTMAFLEK